MRQTDTIIFPRSREVQVVKCDLPAPRQGQVLIQTVRTAVSQGTERSYLIGMDQAMGSAFPMKPGYSVAGYVAEVGPGVTRFKVGDRVIAAANHAAEVIVSEGLAYPIPGDVDFDSACFFSVGCTAVYAVRQVKLKFSESIGVIGQGLIGLITNQMARFAGGLPVIGFDLDPNRREIGRKFGADIVLDPRDEKSVRSVLDGLPGGGVAAAIEFAASGGALEYATEITRERGTVFAGSGPTEKDQSLNVYGPLWFKGLTITTGAITSRPYALEQTVIDLASWPLQLRSGGPFLGSEIFTQEHDLAMFLGMLSHGRFDMKPLITDSVPYTAAPEIFARVLDKDARMLGIVFTWR
jgi:2-desacetyl-2-hydroxyethyl bacteriochlorophyllide A dehydrogenase